MREKVICVMHQNNDRQCVLQTCIIGVAYKSCFRTSWWWTSAFRPKMLVTFLTLALSFSCSVCRFFLISHSLKHLLRSNFLMFQVSAMFLNYPLLSLLPDFKPTPLEHSFCACFHWRWREQSGKGNLWTWQPRTLLRKGENNPLTDGEDGKTKPLFFNQMIWSFANWNKLATCQYLPFFAPFINVMLSLSVWYWICFSMPHCQGCCALSQGNTCW